MEKFPVNNNSSSAETEPVDDVSEVPDYSAVPVVERSPEEKKLEDSFNGDSEVSEHNIEIVSLKARIDEINTLVREGKMNSKDADMEVALAEEEIRSLEQENKEEFQENDEDVEEEEEQEEDGEEKTSESIEKPEGDFEKVEYLRLKKEFKTAEKFYYDAISEDYSHRNVASKFFGLGRDGMSLEVQEAYDKFMVANKNYYEYAQTRGVYQKIAERVNREKKEGEEVTISSAVAGRHVLTPAEKRLELQTVKMPEGIVKIKDKAVNLIKKYPKVAGVTTAGLIATSLFANTAAVVAGLGTRYLGNKFYVKPLQEKQGNIKSGTERVIGNSNVVDLEAMENEYFSATNKAHNAKNRVRMAATAAAIGTRGLASIDFGGDSIVPEVDVPDTGNTNGVLEHNHTQSIIENIKNQAQESLKATLENDNRAWELADKLSIKVEGALDYKMEFGVITEIEGVPVPDEYHLTKEGVHVDVDFLRKQFHSVGHEEVTPDVENASVAIDDEVVNTPEPIGVEATPEPAAKAMISKEYQNLTHRMGWEDLNGLSFGDRIIDKFTHEQITELHELLADTLAKGIHDGNIVLPDPLIVDGIDYTHDLVGYVAKKLPDVSRSWEDIFTPDELSESQWQVLGVRSGDPNNMMIGENIKVGELLKYIMRDELAASPSEDDLVSEAVNATSSQNATNNIVHETTQNGHQYGIGEDGSLYKDGKPLNPTGAEEVQNATPKTPEVAPESVSSLENSGSVWEKTFNQYGHEYKINNDGFLCRDGEVMNEPTAFDNNDMSRIEWRSMARYEKNMMFKALAIRVAKKMGLEVTNHLKFIKQYDVITEINGVKVPEHLHIRYDGTYVNINSMTQIFK